MNKKLLYAVLCLLQLSSTEILRGQSETQNPNSAAGLFWRVKGNAGTTAPTSLIGTALNNNFIGTTDAEDLVIASNNIEKMRFSSGYYMIGIGQQNPQFAIDLTVNPDAVFPCTYNGIRINHPTFSNACGNGFFLGIDNSAVPVGEAGMLYNFRSTGRIQFGIGNTEKMRLVSNGLGINVTSPATQLHITENTGLRNGLMVSQPTSPNSDGVLFGLDVGSINGRDAMVWNYIANGELKFGTQNTERMRIDLNGRVGIGTTIPQRLLHVAGNGNTARIDGLSGAGIFVIAPSASTDRLMYADVNGDLRAIPGGSNGQILSINGSGVPQWTTSSATNDWSITGNSGTVDGTNFIGTTDNVPFNIRVNNQKAGRIDHVNGTTSFGYQSANVVSTGLGNSAFGYQALLSTNIGSYNTAVGNYAMRFNTSGANNTSIGESSLYNNTGGLNNVAVGFESMFTNTGGTANVGVGSGALRTNTTATGGVAVGHGALGNNITGNYNTGVGFGALTFNTTGSNNIAVGRWALYSNTTASFLLAMGDSALFSNTTGTQNVAVGSKTLWKNTIGFKNTSLGFNALYSNVSGSLNTAVGNDALLFNNNGNWNTAVGESSLYFNNSGEFNTAVGHAAAFNNSSGSNNVAIGEVALYSATNATDNVAVGANALYNAVSSRNTAVGSSALFSASNPFSPDNTAIGYKAMYSTNNGFGNFAGASFSMHNNTSGYSNTTTGYYSMYSNTTGSFNTAYGSQAMQSNTTGYSNVAIGVDALNKNTTRSNLVAVGDSALYSNSFGTENVAIGSKSLLRNTGGANNSALGSKALFSNVNGAYNTAIGNGSLYSSTGNDNTATGAYSAYNNTGGQNSSFGARSLYLNTAGIANSAFGVSALYGNLGGSQNTAIGSDALFTHVSGNGNTAVGSVSFYLLAGGDRNTAVGYNAGTPAGVSLNNATAIGANAYVSQSNSMVLGSINGVNGATASVNVGIGTTAPAYTLDAQSALARTGSFTNTATNSDMYGVFGSCNNTPFYGYGASFQGGYIGTYTQASLAGTGSRYALNAYANSGSSAYGVYSSASNATSNYGVYGTASGGTTNWAGYFNGAVFGTSYTTSDRKLKRDIQPLTNASALLAQLKPATYYYRTDEYRHMNLEEGLQYGLLADEVNEVVPGAVKKAISPPLYENNDEKNGKLLAPAVEFNALNYTELIPIMIATIQEQQQQINHLTQLLEGRK